MFSLQLEKLRGFPRASGEKGVVVVLVYRLLAIFGILLANGNLASRSSARRFCLGFLHLRFFMHRLLPCFLRAISLCNSPTTPRYRPERMVDDSSFHPDCWGDLHDGLLSHPRRQG